MQVKLVLGGEGLKIPKIDVGMGIAFLKLWIDGVGYTSATNQIGSLGYILLETQVVDIGDPDEDVKNAFSHLHGRVANFEITPTLFVKDGGIAQISIIVNDQAGGNIVPRKIDFQATDCTGVAVTTEPLKFSCEMLQMLKGVAMEDQQISDDALAMAVDDAPQSEEGSSGETTEETASANA